jgi:predicted permease
MSILTRLRNVFRGDRLRSEIEEELESHVAEAMERGRSEEEARRALGNALQQREASYGVRVAGWLDALKADVVFGWRQMKRNKVTSAAAVLSLALAMGACVSAFRLMDALLWRPLPVAHPERLYGLSRQGIGFDGKWGGFDGWAYPAFVQMQEAVKNDADLIAVSYADRSDVTYTTDQEMEKATVEHVSGNMFGVFGLRPETGRLLTPADDAVPGKAPYAVISDNYWARRFQRDPNVIGKTLHYLNGVYEIVGVGPKGFTGTAPGTVVDVFLPTAMNRGVKRSDSTWIRTLVALHEGSEARPVRDKLAAVSHQFEEKRLSGETGLSAETLKNVLSNEFLMTPAATGISDYQTQYRPALMALTVLVAMVLLIACANVANLMAAQAAGRAKEMALRISIGAGRGRLVQMVLVESGVMALLAAAGGALFAWWSAPMVVRMIGRPDDPVQLLLPADGRVILFGVALTIAVMLLFGLLPALRASWVRPVSVLKGGDEPRSRRRVMHAMIGAQVAFCFVVLFVAGLFVATFERLSTQPTGFSSERLLLVDTTGKPGVPMTAWDEVAEHLRAVPGVERVSLCSWPLLKGVAMNDSISVNGAPPSTELAYFLNISPGWLETMKIPLVDGREFREDDYSPGPAIVNETFVKKFLGGGNAVGRVFDKAGDNGGRVPMRVVGVMKDAYYSSIHQPMLAVVFTPLAQRPKPLSGAAAAEVGLPPILTMVVKTSSDNPMAMATTMRREVPKARADMRAVNVQTQEDLNRLQTVRERLLAMLSFFFGAVALLLAAIGLYGVLHYTVLEQQHEIGIRLALGARVGHIVRKVSGAIVVTVAMGTAAGIALGIAASRYVGSLLYGVKSSDAAMIGIPLATIAVAVVLAAVPAVRRALRVDPVEMLRAE